MGPSVKRIEREFKREPAKNLWEGTQGLHITERKGGKNGTSLTRDELQDATVDISL